MEKMLLKLTFEQHNSYYTFKAFSNELLSANAIFKDCSLQLKDFSSNSDSL